MEIKIEDNDLPGLYQTADEASKTNQKKYFNGILWYLLTLFLASLVAYIPILYSNEYYKIFSAFLFLLSLSIMVWLRLKKPDDLWYCSRALAESVKTRSWRWMMRTEPYFENCNEVVRKSFIKDLKILLKQNERLFNTIDVSNVTEDAISNKMLEVRNLDLNERFAFYKRERVSNQEIWYKKKAKFNKKRARYLFYITICLHAIAIFLLIYNIKEPDLILPIQVIAVGATSIFTWLQSKKYNELFSSYSLTAHEIVLIKSEILNVENEEDFSNYVLNCENAFSREHTQWFARKSM